MPLPEAERLRLAPQLQAVYAVLADGQWHTMAEISAESPGLATCASARIRDLRNRGVNGRRFRIDTCRRKGTGWYRLTEIAADGQGMMFP